MRTRYRVEWAGEDDAGSARTFEEAVFSVAEQLMPWAEDFSAADGLEVAKSGPGEWQLRQGGVLLARVRRVRKAGA